jgi:hypothetical protein
MSVIIQGSQTRNLILGAAPVFKSTGTLAATTISLFTIAGGDVLITALWGKVTTSVTVANSYKLQLHPTTGATQDLCVATDIGTTDTVAGTLLTFAQGSNTLPPKLLSIGYGNPLMNAVVTTGIVESVSAGTDGVISWFATWVPLTDGATLIAA